MAQNEVTYTNLFTVEERKKIIAQAMRELRKSSGLSQKEAAAQIGISQATYSTYERGRNEPPAEILVRLSYLFKCPVDILVQRDRLYRTANDALKQVEQYRAEIAKLQQALAEGNGDASTTKVLLDMMEKLGDALAQTAQRTDISQAINDPLA